LTPAGAFDNKQGRGLSRLRSKLRPGDSGISIAEGIVSILRVGATKKFSDGWEQAFGGKKKAAAKPAAAAAKPAKKAKKAPVKKKKK
jgi:hypothetical protein